MTSPAYREWAPPAALAAHVARVWAREGARDSKPATVLPDGSADLVLAGGRLMLVGTMTRAISAVGPGVAAGVRLRPEAARLLGFPAFELTDERIAVADAWGRDGAEIEERALQAVDPDAAAAVLVAAVADRIDRDRSVDVLVGAAAGRLEGDASVRVDDLCRDLHVSERQLRRRFLSAVGIGPATFRRVVRLQRLVALAATSDRETTLARLAVDAGYADQSHLARDARSLAGVTPGALVRRGG